MYSTTIQEPPLKGWVLKSGVKILEVYPGEFDAYHGFYQGRAKVEGKEEYVPLDWWIQPSGELILGNLQLVNS